MGELDSTSLQRRRSILQTLVKGQRGHLASAFSIVEILRVLYEDVLRIGPERLNDPQRDRFILSKGHGCVALYVQLVASGLLDERHLESFCHHDGLLGGHPEHHIPGVEASTGSLGHGLSMATGMALAARMDGSTARFFVLVGDGECNEGSIWEAALHAAKHRLDRLTVIVDANGYQSFGPTEQVSSMEPFGEKFKAFGFSALEVDGHDVGALRDVLSQDPPEGRPRAIIARTLKGKGSPFTEGNLDYHHVNRFTAETAAALEASLGRSEG